MFKRAKTISWIAGLFFALSGFLAGGALAGISTTKHNLSSSGTGTIKSTDQPEICIFCHTPHDAIKNANIPLWNHTLSTTASYGVYASPTMTATDTTDVGGVTAATAAVSNLCLSCHDGTVAINNFKNPSNMNPVTTMVGTTVGMLPVGNSNLGTDLTNDHPVNFTYNTTLATADGFLVNPVDATGSGLSNGLKLFSSKVQCASCHDPHTSAQGAFLRASMNGSTLCLSCHSK
ncbi:MAG: cytochrome c3 family protein [Sulfurimicrobium sp.]|nr:cytochrome c3 family protein [Sulfurimicrobium sp.]